MEVDSTKSTADYNRLNDLVQRFLGIGLGRDIDGYPTIYEKRIPDAALSDGQTILLQLAVEIFATSQKLSNFLIFLDEPENHLHPSACTDMIAALQQAAPDSQIWIATHSLSILSSFPDATLLLVQDGTIERCGTKPEKVLRELVGGDEQIQRFTDFLNLPSTYAMNRFAAECLFPPKVIGGKSNDDQTKQIAEQLEKLRLSKGGPLRVLDFGAGKGRLLENLSAEIDDIGQLLDYFAVDSSQHDADACTQVIRAVFADDRKRHFLSLQDVLSACDPRSFDLIILCNVLHEIDPKDWLALFESNGELDRMLAPSGRLLVVEDEQIPVGEKAYQKGFIVLDTAALRTLFGITEADDLIVSTRRNGRLKAHLIPSACISRVNADRRKTALQDRARMAKLEIKKLRDAPPNYMNGRRHGFWVQQLANVHLALDEL